MRSRPGPGQDRRRHTGKPAPAGAGSHAPPRSRSRSCCWGRTCPRAPGATVPHGLVRELMVELCHPHVHGHPRKAPVPHHTHYVQRLDHDDPVAPGKPGRELVQCIPADPGDAGVQSVQPPPRLLAVLAPRLPPRPLPAQYGRGGGVPSSMTGGVAPSPLSRERPSAGGQRPPPPRSPQPSGTSAPAPPHGGRLTNHRPPSRLIGVSRPV